MPESRQRIDKWLWFARIVKTRVLAAALVSDSQVRVNRVRITKPGYDVSVGDVLTISVAGRVRVLKILACAARRGPASEAQLLYEDMSEAQSGHAAPQKDAADS